MNKRYLLILLFTFFFLSWPIEANCASGFPTKFVTKILSNLRVKTEKAGIKATIYAERNVPRVAPRISVNAVRAANRSKVQPALNISVYPCLECNGTGRLRNSAGYTYSCRRCGGTGKIFKKTKNQTVVDK